MGTDHIQPPEFKSVTTKYPETCHRFSEGEYDTSELDEAVHGTGPAAVWPRDGLCNDPDRS